MTGMGGGGFGGSFGRNAAKEMGLDSGGVDWVQVRRDVNRSNSLSKTEKGERRDRCQMMDQPMLNPVDELYVSHPIQRSVSENLSTESASRDP